MDDWNACKMPLGISWPATKGSIVRRSLGTSLGTWPDGAACNFSFGVEVRERSWVLVVCWEERSMALGKSLSGIESKPIARKLPVLPVKFERVSHA
jgi:hypothetical protein